MTCHDQSKDFYYLLTQCVLMVEIQMAYLGSFRFETVCAPRIESSNQASIPLISSFSNVTTILVRLVRLLENQLLENAAAGNKLPKQGQKHSRTFSAFLVVTLNNDGRRYTPLRCNYINFGEQPYRRFHDPTLLSSTTRERSKPLLETSIFSLCISC